MTVNNVIDTLLNVLVFAFIGILVWLYFKREPEVNKADSEEGFAEN
jgi:hypothetical protein